MKHLQQPDGKQLCSCIMILDADNGQRLECSTGRVATQDIVQFFPVHDVHITLPGRNIIIGLNPQLFLHGPILSHLLPLLQESKTNDNIWERPILRTYEESKWEQYVLQPRYADSYESLLLFLMTMPTQIVASSVLIIFHIRRQMM
ncbi:hypothetical protein Tco_1278400, partial [Tanacetum coccineum]